MEFKDLESAREKYAKKLKTFIAVGLAIFALSIIISLVSLSNLKSISFVGFLFPFTLIVIAIIAIIAVFATKKDTKTYRSLYKACFVERNLCQIFTDVHYSHELGMPKAVLESTDMIRTGDVYRSNDLTSAKYKDVRFSQADVEIEEESTDSDGNTHYVTIFKGRWMIFEFPKPFTFRLEVVQKWFTASKKLKKNRETNRQITKISTESLTFDRKFNVYAEDGFEAYYILDPAFIDHIEKLSESHKGKLLLCFIDNKLHVAINDNKDAFEPPSPFKPLDEQTENQKIQAEIRTITDFVDFLKLDRKLFKN